MEKCKIGAVTDTESDEIGAVHPAYYQTDGYECIDVMFDQFGEQAVLDFCHLNAFKYIYRARQKNGIEDLKKAIYYLTKEISILECATSKTK